MGDFRMNGIKIICAKNWPRKPRLQKSTMMRNGKTRFDLISLKEIYKTYEFNKNISINRMS